MGLEIEFCDLFFKIKMTPKLDELNRKKELMNEPVEELVNSFLKNDIEIIELFKDNN